MTGQLGSRTRTSETKDLRHVDSLGVAERFLVDAADVRTALATSVQARDPLPRELATEPQIVQHRLFVFGLCSTNQATSERLLSLPTSTPRKGGTS